MSQHQGGTDTANKVKLTSSIEQVMWKGLMASPGATTGLEVFTKFVGNGADLQIELSDAGGKKLGTFKDKITGNRFWAPIAIPPEAKDALFAEVKLPKHGLTKKSGALLLTPPIQITNAKWDKQEAGRGDILKLTADVKGAYDGTEAEISIWEHDADGAHDPITKFPALVDKAKVSAEWEFEYQDDTDDIPTEEESENGYQWPEYFFRVEILGVKAESGLLRFKDWIEIELVDQDDNPEPGEQYVLTLPDGSERKGQLDADGKVREEQIPPGPYAIRFPDLEE
ncbi:MAG TPA: hypothetical protein VFG50_04380 [Rhodothermales bacterium]|nr:hypothetical protein [Rhodothermales bacterium]